MKLGRFFALVMFISGLFLSGNAVAGCPMAGDAGTEAKDTAAWGEKMEADSKDPSAMDSMKTKADEKTAETTPGDEE